MRDNIHFFIIYAIMIVLGIVFIIIEVIDTFSTTSLDPQTDNLQVSNTMLQQEIEGLKSQLVKSKEVEDFYAKKIDGLVKNRITRELTLYIQELDWLLENWRIYFGYVRLSTQPQNVNTIGILKRKAIRIGDRELEKRLDAIEFFPETDALLVPYWFALADYLLDKIENLSGNIDFKLNDLDALMDPKEAIPQPG